MRLNTGDFSQDFSKHNAEAGSRNASMVNLCWILSSQHLPVNYPWCHQRIWYSKIASTEISPGPCWTFVGQQSQPSRKMTSESKIVLRLFRGHALGVSGAADKGALPRVHPSSNWHIGMGNMLGPCCHHEFWCQERDAEPRLQAELPNYCHFLRPHRDGSHRRRYTEEPGAFLYYIYLPHN